MFIQSCTVRELDGFKFRVVAQLLGYPHIVWYVDKYLNSLYDSNSVSFKDFIYTMNTIVSMNNIQNQNALRFSKFQNVERNTFYKDVVSSYKVIAPDRIVTNADVLCLYNMYQNGVISHDDVIGLKDSTSPTSEGKAPRATRSKSKAVAPKVAGFRTKTEVKDIAVSEEITKYKNNILQFVKNRANCDSCPLQKNGFLILSTNSPRPSSVDITFINDGASDQEIDSQEHFSMYDDLLDDIKRICDKFKITYAFINLTMCNTRGAKTPAKMKQAIKSCDGIYSEIRNTFKSRLNVLFGESVKNAFGIKGGRTTKLHGQMIGNNIISIAPDKLTDKNQTILLNSLIEVIAKTKFDKGNIEVEPNDAFKGRMVSSITPDLTLFDVKEINSKMLYIMVNKEGEKVYYIEEMQFPVHIKAGSMAECEYILDEKPDETMLLSKYELQGLKRVLRDNINGINRL